ncbi:putative carnosine synthase 1 [Xylogone sp. PMI_703]|nr:putative carnosine synthase 1 [Xylogone sp. PMI_703]
MRWAMDDHKTCVIQVSLPGRCLSALCEWSFQKSHRRHSIRNLYLVPKSTTPEDDTQVPALGHTVSVSNLPHSPVTYTLDSSKSPEIANFLSCLLERRDEHGMLSRAAAFLTPDNNGFVARSEFMVYRLAGCPLVSSIQSFLSPLSEIKAFLGQVNGLQDVASALEISIGAIEFPLSAVEYGIPQLEYELEQRLALSWTLPNRIHEWRVCIVLPRMSIAATKSRWETAAALGIKVVVLSSGSWWAEGCEPWGHLRESFISTDLTTDDELWQRIVDAVESYPYRIDGICTLTGNYLVSVAKAAEKLGLPSSGPQPFSIATDKYLTRKLLEPDSINYFSVQSLEELEYKLESDSAINFPVISKPVFGRGSENVFKSENVVELREAIVKTLASQKSSRRVLVEPYVNGPEVDANLILRDGRLLYSEVVDDFPSPAELEGNFAGALFTETQTAAPSKLPKNECEAIITFMLARIRQMGFHTGIFHCEARVQNSCMDYILAPGTSFPDLQPVTDVPTDAKPSVFLHEVNARIPGIMSSASTLISRGVDFFALQILCAVADWPRYEALASPFLDGILCNHVLLTNVYINIGSQLTKKMFSNVPADRFESEMVDSDQDPMREILQRNSEVSQYILCYNAIVKSGYMYGGGKDTWLWALCAVIWSPLSRRHALHVAELL